MPRRIFFGQKTTIRCVAFRMAGTPYFVFLMGGARGANPPVTLLGLFGHLLDKQTWVLVHASCVCVIFFQLFKYTFLFFLAWQSISSNGFAARILCGVFVSRLLFISTAYNESKCKNETPHHRRCTVVLCCVRSCVCGVEKNSVCTVQQKGVQSTLLTSNCVYNDIERAWWILSTYFGTHIFFWRVG